MPFFSYLSIKIAKINPSEILSRQNRNHEPFHGCLLQLKKLGKRVANGKNYVSFFQDLSLRFGQTANNNSLLTPFH